jgi:hypothetical protein
MSPLEDINVIPQRLNDCFYDPQHLFFNSILLQTDGHDIQFLEETDLLADYIPILAAPGEVLLEGSRVALKCDLGEGYSAQISFAIPTEIDKPSISKVTSPSPRVSGMLSSTWMRDHKE